MKRSSIISLLGIGSLLCLALLWAAGGVNLKKIVGWGYRTVYITQPRDKVEDNINRVAAVHFDLVCATCHGSPADPQRGKQLRLSPPAPSLHLRAGEMPPEMMFQVIKDGIQNTAMPGWPASGRDDEVWLMVAFLEKLPDLGSDQYQALAGPLTLANYTPPLSTCLRCHGANTAGQVTLGLPRIEIQSPIYISDSLRAYRERVRASGFMQSATSGLSDTEIESLANHFGGQQTIPEDLERSASESNNAPKLVLTGSPFRQIPACAGCHGQSTPVRPDFPRLSGQNSAYLERQLRLFVSVPHLRGGGPFLNLMAEAVRNLEEEDIKELSHWYSIPHPTQH